MRRFRVSWVEKHDVIVMASNEEEAVNQAMDSTNDVESRKNQSISFVDDLGPVEDESEEVA